MCIGLQWNLQICKPCIWITFSKMFKNIFIGQILKFENSKMVKIFDFCILLSTLILTGVPYHLRESPPSYQLRKDNNVSLHLFLCLSILIYHSYSAIIMIRKILTVGNFHSLLPFFAYFTKKSTKEMKCRLNINTECVNKKWQL